MPQATKVLILGAGFAGIHAAMKLERLFHGDRNVEITLVSHPVIGQLLGQWQRIGHPFRPQSRPRKARHFPDCRLRPSRLRGSSVKLLKVLARVRSEVRQPFILGCCQACGIHSSTLTYAPRTPLWNLIESIFRRDQAGNLCGRMGSQDED
jgi:hypothetical protein